MSVLAFAIITIIIFSISFICFSCLSVSSKYDSAFELYMREYRTTEIIDTTDIY